MKIKRHENAGELKIAVAAFSLVQLSKGHSLMLVATAIRPDGTRQYAFKHIPSKSKKHVLPVIMGVSLDQ